MATSCGWSERQGKVSLILTFHNCILSPVCQPSFSCRPWSLLLCLSTWEAVSGYRTGRRVRVSGLRGKGNTGKRHSRDSSVLSLRKFTGQEADKSNWETERNDPTKRDSSLWTHSQKNQYYLSPKVSHSCILFFLTYPETPVKFPKSNRGFQGRGSPLGPVLWAQLCYVLLLQDRWLQHEKCW